MTTVTRSSLLRGLSVQSGTIRALIVRDMMLRYGRNNIGFLWVVLEPMVLTASVLLLFSQVKSSHEHGTHVLSMVLTGYMPLTMWRHVTNQGVHMLRRSYSILYHRNVTVLDVFLARICLEGISTSAALTAVYALLWVGDIVDTIAKPGHLIAAWILLWWLSSSVALVLAVITEVSETSERFVQPVMYIMVPTSGIFFMVDWLPAQAQKVIVYNPLNSCIELFRDGFFGDTVNTHYILAVPIVFSFVLTWIGLVFLQHARDRMVPP